MHRKYCRAKILANLANDAQFTKKIPVNAYKCM